MRSAAALARGWQYVVVEEVVGATVEMLRWPWPHADPLGRLFWADDADDRVMTAAVPQRLLRLQLYRPNDLVRRPRAGDTFAAKISRAAEGWDRATAVDDLAELFPGPVYDVSADSREAAKLAYQGATSAVFDGSRDVEMLEEAHRNREKRPRARRLDGGPARPGHRRRGGRAVNEVVIRPVEPDTLAPATAGSGALVEAILEDPGALVYFLLNVGDGDTQLLLLPPDSNDGARRLVIVDVATTSKLPDLIEKLHAVEVPAAAGDRPLIQEPGSPGQIRLLVATHPHFDHIGGMAELSRQWAIAISGMSNRCGTTLQRTRRRGLAVLWSLASILSAIFAPVPCCMSVRTGADPSVERPHRENLRRAIGRILCVPI